MALHLLRTLAIAPLAQAVAHAAPPEQAVITSFPQPALAADDLGVIVNDDDPDSVAIAAYYLKRRGLPAANLVHVRRKPGRSTL